MEYKSTNHILKLPSIGYIMLALRITILALRDNFSGLNNSNVNKVIRAVLNSLFFFFTKRIRTHQKHKTLQANKNENALKNI